MTENSRFFSAETDVFIRRSGCILIAVATAALGVLSIYTGDFAYTWQPVPEELPGRALLARITGVVFVGVSVCFLIPRTLRKATVAIVIIFWAWLLLLHIPRLIGGENWLGTFEFLLPAGAGLALLAMITPASQQPAWRDWVVGEKAIKLGRMCFGVGLIGCGMSHFIYIEGAAQLLPEWFPARTFFTYLTGAGHIAAGLSLLTGVLTRIAAPLLCFMLACFVLLLHVPRVVADPGSRHEWTMLVVSSLFSGTAWLIAAAVLRGRRRVTSAGTLLEERSPGVAVG